MQVHRSILQAQGGAISRYSEHSAPAAELEGEDQHAWHTDAGEGSVSSAPARRRGETTETTTVDSFLMDLEEFANPLLRTHDLNALLGTDSVSAPTVSIMAPAEASRSASPPMGYSPPNGCVTNVDVFAFLKG